MNDFEDFLKKAIEKDMQGDDMDGDNIFPEPPVSNPAFLKMMKILKTGRLMELGSASREKTNEVIEKLVSDLQSLEKMDMSTYRAKAILLVRNASRTLDMLDFIVSMCAAVGSEAFGNSEKNASDILDDLIVRNLLFR